MDLLDHAREHLRAGRLREAVRAFRAVLDGQPDHPKAVGIHNNLGVLLLEAGECQQAVGHFRAALERQPGCAEARNNLGNAFVTQGQLDEALGEYRRALEIRPDYAEAHNNLGVALRQQRRLDEALACLERALALRPDYAEAHNNLGTVLHYQARFEQADSRYRRALSLQPDHARCRTNRAVLQLFLGNLREGWAEYEWRLKATGDPTRHLREPRWDGAPLDGRTLLLWAEQGLGDTLQFIRFAGLCRQRGGRVVVVCQPRLLPLLRSCREIDQLVAHGDLLPAFDVHAPLLSVPGILGTTWETIPASVPYLSADPDLVERWRERLATLEGFNIGICWQGNSAERAAPLAHFLRLADVPGVRLISLQQGTDSALAGGERTRVIDLRSDIDESAGPFMDTAAILRNLDLVITIDSAVGHLAGALGVPVWTALGYVPDWRWFLDRSDTPWYPTMRLFRQPRPGDWQAVFEAIQIALHHGVPAREAEQAQTEVAEALRSTWDSGREHDSVPSVLSCSNRWPSSFAEALR